MYTIICDNCGKNALENEEYSCWGKPFAATEVADEKGWYTDNTENVAYCPDCYEYDDTLVIIKKPTNLKKN